MTDTPDPSTTNTPPLTPEQERWSRAVLGVMGAKPTGSGTGEPVSPQALAKAREAAELAAQRARLAMAAVEKVMGESGAQLRTELGMILDSLAKVAKLDNAEGILNLARKAEGHVVRILKEVKAASTAPVGGTVEETPSGPSEEELRQREQEEERRREEERQRLEKEKELEASKDWLARRRVTVERMKNEAEKALGTLSQGILSLLSKVGQILDGATGKTEPAEIDKAVEATDDPLGEMETSVEKLRLERAAYLPRLAAAKQALAGLNAHPEKAAFLAEIGVQAEAVRKAEEETAKAHRYFDAVTALNTAIGACAALEAQADARQKYTAVLGDREGRVNGLTNPSGLAPVNEAIQKVKDKLNKAKEHGTAKRFTEATKLLDELVQDCIDTGWMSKMAKEYGWKRSAREGHLNELKLKIVPEVQPLLDVFEKNYVDSDYATTKDYVVSVRLLGIAYGMKSTIEANIEQVKKAKEALKKLADEIPVLKGLDGADGIEEDIKKQQAEHDYAEAKITKTEYVGAKALIDAAILKWPDIRKKAQEYKKLEDQLKPANTEYETIAAMPGASGAVDKLNAIHDLLDDAKTQGKAGKLEEARVALTKARQMMPEARYLALKAHVVDGVGKPPADPTAGEPEQVTALLNEFDGVYNAVNSDPNKTHGQAGLSAAATKRGEAITARDKETPDYATAKAKLNAAILDALKARRDIDEAVARLAAFQELVNGFRAMSNTDGVVNTERQQIRDKDTAARQALNLNPPDHATAHRLYTEGLQVFEKAKGLLAAYDKYKPLVGPVTTLIDNLDVQEADDGIPELVQAIRTDFNTAKDHALPANRRYKEALALIEDVQKRAPALDKMVDDYIDACDSRDRYALPAKLDEFRNKPIVAEELAQMEAMRQEMLRKFDERMFGSANRLAIEINWAKRPAREILTAYKAYTDALDKVTPKLQTLDSIKNAAVTEELARIQEVVRKAKEAITRCEGREPRKIMLIDEAKTTLLPLPGELDTAIQLARDYAAYAPALLTANQAISGLETHPQKDAVEHRIEAAKAVVRQAEGLAAQKQCVAARQLVDTVPELCRLAKEFADSHGQFAAAASPEAGRKLDTADAGALGEEIRRARGLLSTLRSHGAGALLKDRLDALGKKIDAAELAVGSDKLAEARTALSEVFWQLSYTHTVGDQHLQFREVLGEAKEAMSGVRSHTHAALVDAEVRTMDFELGLAEQNARQELFDSALRSVAEARAQCQTALAACYAHDAYTTERKKQMDRLDLLAAHPHRYSIDADLKELRKLFGEADDTAAGLAHPAAMTMLGTIRNLLATVELKAKMNGGAEPTDDELKAILSQPDGSKALDRIVEKLDPATKRKVVHKAFNLRFDVDLQMLTGTDAVENLPEAKAPNILKLYDVLSKVPDKYTRDSASMKVIKRQGDDVGTSSFWSVDKSLKLKIGRADEKNEKVLADPVELPNIDPALRPVEGAAPKFNWTTLHEIAHSIDDRTNYMNSNGSSADHGGWKSHGGNVGEIAKAAAEEFDYDARYIEAYLQGGEGSKSYPVPKPQRGIDPDQWERNRIEAVTWCDAIRHGKSIWYNDAECAKRQIKGRVYQESYGNDWTSYLYAARSKGVTGYQFRAPGEWFSEIYAAYHTGRLPGSHPARSFLAQFGEPKK